MEFALRGTFRWVGKETFCLKIISGGCARVCMRTGGSKRGERRGRAGELDEITNAGSPL